MIKKNLYSIGILLALTTVGAILAPQPPATSLVIPLAVPTAVPLESAALIPVVAASSTSYVVTSVVDGDTLKISLDGKIETVRLIGINTPETVDPRKPVECFGREASNKAKELLTGRQVRIEKDPSQEERDKYGRFLVYVYRDDGLFFNKYMIEEGYAYEYTYDVPYKYQLDFKQAEETAQNTQKGLWAVGACSTAALQAAQGSTQPSGHTFYLSTYRTARYYYCDTDSVWKGLSPKYLKSYSSEQALLKEHPSQTLHEPCK